MRTVFPVLLLVLAIPIFYLLNESYLVAELNKETIEIPPRLSDEFRAEDLRIAVVGDLHISDDLASYSGLTSLLKEILISEPDLIFLLGDYTSSPAFVSDMGAHRSSIADRLSVLTSVPVFAVMGNYETISLGERLKYST